MEKAALPEGKEVLMTVVRVAHDPDREAFLRSRGSAKGFIDDEKLIHDMCEFG